MALMGVAIVTYNSAVQILGCLNSLMADPEAARLRIVIVDNASQDATCARIDEWAQSDLRIDASDKRLSNPVTLIRSAENSGFAAGINIALRTLLRDPEIDRFWILNPDTRIGSGCVRALLNERLDFALLGMRIRYEATPDLIQLDAGHLDRRTGVSRNLNIGRVADETPLPDDTEIDFVSGASMVAARSFVEQAGLMPEEYFLYYEEVDWALRRGELSLRISKTAEVFHAAGASIGSPTLQRGASLLSLYHKHRSRMKFLARWYPRWILGGWVFGCLKAAQLTWRHGWRAGAAVLAGQFGLRNPFPQRQRYVTTELSSTSKLS